MAAVTALVLYVVWFAVAFGIRSVVHRRRTGDAGFRGLSGRPGSAAWWAGVLFAAAIVIGLLVPIAALLGLESIHDGRALQLAGLGIAVAGMVATVVAQAAMGRSWRVGVDAGERTELVTGGAFRWARNPVFSAMILTAVGLTLMVPNVLGLAGLTGLLVAIELQVRVVEEPYLLKAHPESYPAYAARTGRFLPRVGRLRRTSSLVPE
ncbi:protein-S-isoprenylcysteine O-methyltransferase Ste14 [Kribbella amoyensis]|uniref:Protein-S-isoprenylcysteine O-methyltransferase Ste14 n=1 Tax=Kribbella amoyensis TaxID=996641 RepID=A0A561BRA4_9ACTN|nr:isoprenylcysteine carboxylmethyltransferase family protein [Kribbella amoyensis]TWD81379.1 protein-S-isoprenylcysteine O-methyltransferase Ste14 [Kribbella amoyensis]